MKKRAQTISTGPELTLASISNNILYIATEFPELKSENRKDTEAAVNHVLDVYTTLKTEHNEKVEEIPAMIARAAEHYPALQGNPTDDVNQAVRRVIDEYKDLVAEFEATINNSSNIAAEIVDASRHYPALQGVSTEDPEGAVHHLLQVYKDLVHLYRGIQDETKRLQTVEMRCTNLEDSLREAQTATTKNLKLISDLDRAKRKLDNQLVARDEKHITDLANARQKHEKEQLQTKTAKNELQRKYDDLKVKQSSELAKLRGELQRENAASLQV